MFIKVSQYIADELVNRDITDLFTVTGGGAMHLNDAFGHKEGLHCTYNHHEQACAIAAEAYTRFSGKLAAVCVTSGPGGTNALTGVLGGWLDSIPMLILSGQVKFETTVHSTDVPLRQLGDQEYPIVDVVQHMTKYAYMITNPNEIAYHLEKAIYLATHGRGGPTWLDIPLDVQGAKIDPKDLKHFDPSEFNEDTGSLSQATAQEILDRILAAKSPVILAGTAIRLAGAHPQFLDLIQKLQIPVVTAWNAHDVLWDEHPLFSGKPGTVGTRGGNFVVQNSDLLLSIGCRMNIRMISYNKFDFAKNAYKIIIDIDEGELNKPTIKADMAVHADLLDVINAMLAGSYPANCTNHQQWLSWCRQVNAKYPAVLPRFYQTDHPLNPYVFIQKLFEHLNGEDRIACGNGSACVITFQAANIKKGMRLFTNSGCASMGYGLPAALGVSVASSGHRAICIDGDGSIQMNIQEFQTIIHNNMNIIIFILNNNGYHSIRQTQNNLFKPPLVGVSKDSGVSFPDMEKLAAAYGFIFHKIDKQEGIDTILDQVLTANGPTICEVVVDDKQNFEPKLSSKVHPDGTITSPSIDDMYPFLSPDEYAQNKLTELPDEKTGHF